MHNNDERVWVCWKSACMRVCMTEVRAYVYTGTMPEYFMYINVSCKKIYIKNSKYTLVN